MNVAASETFISTMVDRIVRGFQPLRVVLFGISCTGYGNRMERRGPTRNSAQCVRQAAHGYRGSRRALGDLPVCKDIVIATPEEVASRGHLVGTALRFSSPRRKGSL